MTFSPIVTSMDAYVINIIVKYHNIQLPYMTNSNHLKDTDKDIDCLKILNINHNRKYKQFEIAMREPNKTEHKIKSLSFQIQDIIPCFGV